jgi:hypothetical protein
VTRSGSYRPRRRRSTSDALLRLIRQRWSIEIEWHWARDAQLGEDAHRYANRAGASVFSFLRTVVMNLLRRGGYRSIRQGLHEPAYDIKRILEHASVHLAQGGCGSQRQPLRVDRTFRSPAMGDTLLFVAFVDRESVRRIIRLHKANRREVNHYVNAIEEDASEHDNN